MTPRPFVTEGTADVKIEMAGVRCVVKDSQEPPEPVSSNYVASYQQEVNPLYVQLQSQLQQAQIEYAKLKVITPPTRRTMVGPELPMASQRGLHKDVSRNFSSKWHKRRRSSRDLLNWSIPSNESRPNAQLPCSSRWL